MHNLLGTMPDAALVLSIERASLHNYGKEPRAGRKLGHVTQLVPDGSLEAAAAQLRAQLQPH